MSCPICDKLTQKAYRPFCSGRCADIDLGKWLTGAYAVPASETDAFSEDTSPNSAFPDQRTTSH